MFFDREKISAFDSTDDIFKSETTHITENFVFFRTVGIFHRYIPGILYGYMKFCKYFSTISPSKSP